MKLGSFIAMSNEEFIHRIIELDDRLTELKILAISSKANPLFLGYAYYVAAVLDEYKKQHNLDELFLNLKERN